MRNGHVRQSKQSLVRGLVVRASCSDRVIESRIFLYAEREDLIQQFVRSVNQVDETVKHNIFHATIKK